MNKLSAFWEQFFRTDWRHQGAVLEHPQVRPLATEDALLRVLKRAAKQVRAGLHVELRLYIDLAIPGEPELCVPADDASSERRILKRALPTESDRTLREYVQRVESALWGRKFALILNRYPKFDREQWLAAFDFVSGFVEQVGIPVGGVITDIFVGNYSYTPFGIHRDEQCVFTWPVIGTKRILLWPDSAIDRQTSDIETHRERAAVLEVVSGTKQFLYWPDTAWHCAEAVDDNVVVTASLGVSAWVREGHYFQPYVRRLRHSSAAGPTSEFVTVPPVSRNGEIITMHASEAKVADAVAAQFSEAAVRHHAHISGLERLTSLGLGPIPLNDSRSDGGALVVRSPMGVVWEQAGDTITIAGHGEVFVVDASESLLRLVRGLTDTGRIPLNLLSETKWRDEVLPVIEHLEKLGVLVAGPSS